MSAHPRHPLVSAQPRALWRAAGDILRREPALRNRRELSIMSPTGARFPVARNIMQRHFDQELGELRERLLTMGSYAAASVTNAIKALLERDDDLARKVKSDDQVLDRLEMEIDGIAIRLLAKAPLASDLRFITIAMKISHNLERVGDEATTIGRRAILLNCEPQLRPLEELARNGSLGLTMLKEALDSFVNHDPDKARQIIPRDQEINRSHKQLEHDLIEVMGGDPSAIRRCLNLIVISKSIERIADHATNIAEEVVYLYEARDIRHPAAPEPV